MKKLLRMVAVAVLGVGLSAAGVSAATGTITGTGPDSKVTVEDTTKSSTDVKNHNKGKATVNNPQHAWSGDAKATGSTTAGGATSGTASNASAVAASFTVANSMPSMGTGVGGDSSYNVSNTGPSSKVNVSSKATQELKVVNNNDMEVTVNNKQNAHSGDATVNNNTTGGSATSGNASNSSSTTVNMNFSN